MKLGPHSLFGKSPFYKGPINHLALNGSIAVAGGAVKIDLKPRASVDGRKYRPILLSGDLAKAKSSLLPEGAFQPLRLVKFKAKYYLFGSLWTSLDAPEAAVFTSTDKRRWMKVATPYPAEGSIGGEAFVAVAANADFLAAVKPGGPLIWTDGTDWFGRNDLPLAGSGQRANVMLATSAGFAIGGQGASASALITAPTPGGTWTARTHPFSTNRMSAAEAGDLALIFAPYNAAVSAQQLISAPLGNLATWSNVAQVANRQVIMARYAAGKWFAGGYGDWLTAPAGSGPWADAAAKPWAAGEIGRIRSMYHDGAAWNVHYDSGKLALSLDNGASWDRPANSGLAADAIYIAAYLG